MTLLQLRKAAVAMEMTAEAAPNFDRLAGVYRWMEALSFGPWLGRCRCAFLEGMKGSKRALVLGDGDGRFTARLLHDNPLVEIDAIDISPAMLSALLRRAGEDGRRVQATVADLRSGLTHAGQRGDGQKFDLVVTHFVLDCLTTSEVERLAQRVRLLLADDAVWVVSEFAVPAGWFGLFVAKPVVRLLYGAFGWMTGLRVRKLPDYNSALERVGFQLVRRRNWLGGLLVSECWVVQVPASWRN